MVKDLIINLDISQSEFLSSGQGIYSADYLLDVVEKTFRVKYQNESD